MRFFERFSYDRSVAIVSLVSLGATLAGFALMSYVAHLKGLDLKVLTGDSKGYVILAQNLLERGVFSVATSEPYYPESFRAPGYPVFLAALFAIFSFSNLALFVHALLVGTAPILLYLLLRDWHERAAFWGAILFAFEPVRIFLSSSFLSDGLFTLIFLATLLFLEQSYKERSLSYVVLAGVLLGFAILIRPIAIFLPLLLGIYLLLRLDALRLKVVYTSIFLASVLLITGPWMLRNHSLFGSWNISSVGAANLMLYNAPEFLKWYPIENGVSVLETFRAKQSALPREEALSLARSTEFTSAFRQVIEGAELRYVIFHVFKTIPFFITDGLRDTVRQMQIEIGAMPNISTAIMRGEIGSILAYLKTGGLPIALFLIGSGIWGIVTVLCIVEGVRAVFALSWRPVIFLLILIAYFALLTGPVSNARYRVPIEGFMLSIAAFAVLRWYDARHGISSK